MSLKKQIGFLGVFSIASGAMISSGIFVLPGLAFEKAGPAVFLSYFLAGVLGLVGILSVIELSTAMPKAGGDYYFVSKTFGPMLGTVSGILSWVALSLKSAFAVYGITAILSTTLGIEPLISGAVLVAFFVFLNILGAEEAVFFQVLMVLGLIGLMTIFVGVGSFNINWDSFDSFLEGEGVFDNIVSTSSFVFISFGGLLNVANISEEVKNPKRNLPWGIIISVAVVTVFYTLITLIITGTLNAGDFIASRTPVADSAQTFMGDFGYFIILGASTLAFFTTANGGLLAASRYPLALSRDRLMPQALSAVSKKKQTPVLSVVVTGVIIYLSLIFELETLVKVASTVILTSYVLTNVAVLVLRQSGMTNYKPSFRSPLYPWLQIFSIALFSSFIVDLGLEAIEISAGLLIAAFIFYYFYGRKLKNQESALLHLMKKVTDEKLTKNMLEKELLEVLVGRDEIQQDNFDHLIKEAHFVDIDRPMSFEELVNKVAHDTAEDLGMDPEVIIQRFLERQEQSNTAVSEFLAIPHIVLDGVDKMSMTIIRAKKGVSFTDEEPEVKAVFLLGGTKEKRVLHLKTIAAIATLVSSKDFQHHWIDAKTETEIKSMMVLNERKRFL
jgi:APA family basic amino acid/polyamine antiporter